ncbi:PspA/IM30 family protein [Corynebacterium sp. 3HC-13]|uniref:PspA/IM30 family protein n=1 Tax=Corynebacterium poyangense TaxID=2684405 RepID=UPI001CCD7B8C|nr:PspA/IM30 family protein [Corynebacterium poyangense]MBZ8177206.1 PspA/IM30 family protein [Corynebacterium poyangense]
MANPFSKGWKYLTASLDAKIDENADPQIQINQAIEAARNQHRAISEQAATVIGQQHQLELKINRLLQDKEKAEGQTKNALNLADKAASEGNAQTAQEYQQAAEVLATQLVSIEEQISETQTMHQQASQAAEQAKRQQKESESRLQEQLGELEKLRSQAAQADMQKKASEALDGAQQLSGDSSTPTLDSVREKIERRYAQALGAQELVQNSVGEQISNYQSLETDLKASARLEQLRGELGISAGQNQPALEESSTPSEE